MSEHIDKTLAAIDAVLDVGHQSTFETSHVSLDGCVKCGQHTDGNFCDFCLDIVKHHDPNEAHQISASLAFDAAISELVAVPALTPNGDESDLRQIGDHLYNVLLASLDLHAAFGDDE